MTIVSGSSSSSLWLFIAGSIYRKFIGAVLCGKKQRGK